MTDTPTEPFTAATINVGDGTTIEVVADDFDHLDYTCPPGLDLTVSRETEHVTATITAGMEEDDAGALAHALLRAIEAGRPDAVRRGYYRYLAEGEPEYGPPYEWQSDARLSADARLLLAELMKDSDLLGRPADEFAKLALSRPLPDVFAELDRAGLLERHQSTEGWEAFVAASSAWVTAGSRRGEPFDLPGDGLTDALDRVEGFVRGDDVWPLRISDLAMICRVARAVADGARPE
ncbi:hypothetical protein ABZY58_11220 [Micromonospora tulbaghiae]|uniref:hypothetical protein n=1 Tax=Micromonospora tulbaghiae TaxID=479978 RepID=UPI0033ABA554